MGFKFHLIMRKIGNRVGFEYLKFRYSNNQANLVEFSTNKVDASKTLQPASVYSENLVMQLISIISFFIQFDITHENK